MAKTKCGFDSTASSSGPNMLVLYGPTLLVDIGFDPDYDPKDPQKIPISGIKHVEALVDTGAGLSCIDSLLATQLGLPAIDKKPVSGISGQQEANIYMAQVHIPSLAFTLYGAFAGVHLQIGGQMHKALIGRDFLRGFTMVYEGRTGTVTISSDH